MKTSNKSNVKGQSTLGLCDSSSEEERKSTTSAVVNTSCSQSGDQDGDEESVLFHLLPKILDLPEGKSVSKVSCGSRHTAAVTGK